MKVEDKYLPSIEEQKEFIKARITENKKQIHGGQLEIMMAEANGEKRAIVQVEDQMKQIMTNLDIYEKELEKLGN